MKLKKDDGQNPLLLSLFTSVNHLLNGHGPVKTYDVAKLPFRVLAEDQFSIYLLLYFADKGFIWVNKDEVIQDKDL